MTFLQIKKEVRTDRIINYKMVEREDVVKLHPTISDLAAWTQGARMNSRFSLTTSTEKYMYIRLDKFDEKDVPKLAHQEF